MNHTPISVVLLIVALVLFLLAGVGVKHPRLNFIGFGLACYIASLLL